MGDLPPGPVPDYRVGPAPRTALALRSAPFKANRLPQGHPRGGCGAGAVPVRRAAAALPLPKSAGASR